MTEPNPFKFSFYQDDDVLEELTYAEFLKRPELLKRMDDKDYYKLILGREIYQFSYKFLNGDKELTKLMTEFERINKSCPIYFFAPVTQASTDMLNDDSHDVILDIGPNGCGKTTSAILKIILHSIPCDPNWWMFKKYGVKFPQWTGPKKVGLAIDTWRKHKEHIWPELRRWLPDKELGSYGKTFNQIQKRDGPNWKDSPVVPAKCKSRFMFFCYEQMQSAFSSSALDMWLWSEQPPLSRFNEADERTRRRAGFHVMDLTPVREEGRSDSGGGSWIHDMATGTKKLGHNPCVYSWGVPDVPHWVYPEAEKKKAYEKHILEPERTGDQRALREGRARYFGEWHWTSGRVHEDWTPDIHVIDDDESLLDDCTFFRGVDHGYTNPLACLLAAVNKNYDVILFGEYYQKLKHIPVACREIIEMCGNRQVESDWYVDNNTGVQYQRYDEDEVSRVFAKTVLDSRSFASREMGREIGKIYRDNGLRVQPSSGAFLEKQLDAVRELIRIDPNRKHLVTGKMGAARLYVFRSLRNFIWEIEHWVYETWAHEADRKPEKEKPASKDQHLCGSCLCYLAQIPMRYLGPMKPWNRVGSATSPVTTHKPRSSITGY